jgi:hypothetical protein
MELLQVCLLYFTEGRLSYVNSVCFNEVQFSSIQFSVQKLIQSIRFNLVQLSSISYSFNTIYDPSSKFS